MGPGRSPELLIEPVVDLDRMAERLEVSREIAASPQEVYAAISDVTRMGEWSARVLRL